MQRSIVLSETLSYIKYGFLLYPGYSLHRAATFGGGGGVAALLSGGGVVTFGIQ